MRDSALRGLTISPSLLLCPSSRKDSDHHLGRYKGKDKRERGEGGREWLFSAFLVVDRPLCVQGVQKSWSERDSNYRL